MIALIAAEVQLIPDSTAIYQLVIFLTVTALLSFFVFRPVLAVLDRRKEKTEGDQLLASEYVQKCEERFHTYEERIHHARQEAIKAEEQLRQAGFGEAKKIMEAARHSSLETLSRYKAELDKELDRARELLEANTSELANEIIEKILERPAKNEKDKRGHYDIDGDPVGDIH